MIKNVLEFLSVSVTRAACDVICPCVVHGLSQSMSSVLRLLPIRTYLVLARNSSNNFFITHS